MQTKKTNNAFASRHLQANVHQLHNQTPRGDDGRMHKHMLEILSQANRA